MGKYSPLADYLRKQQRNLVPMTFEQIESLVGSLPPSHRYRAWWSNNPTNSVMTKAWLEAGYRSEQVDIDGRKLVFRSTSPKVSQSIPADDLKAGGRAAVSKRHPLYGALKGLVRIAPGTDLTEPADPEWGANV